MSLAGIPTAIWTAAMVLLAAFAGHLIALQIAERRNRHELHIKHLEVKKQLQREVYVSAAETVGGALAALAALPNKSTSDIESTLKDVKMGAVMNKICVVGSNETVKSFLSFSRSLSAAILETSANVLSKDILEAKRKRQSDQINRILEADKQTIELLNLHRARGSEEREVSSLLERLKESSNTLERTIAEEKRLTDEIAAHFFTQAKASTENLVKISTELAEVNLAVRKELGFEINETDFRTELTLSIEHSKTEIEKFFSKLRSIISS